MRTQTNKRKTNMKKIYTLAALMMLTVPAYATDDNTLQDENIPSTETSVSSDRPAKMQPQQQKHPQNPRKPVSLISQRQSFPMVCNLVLVYPRPVV